VINIYQEQYVTGSTSEERSAAHWMIRIEIYKYIWRVTPQQTRMPTTTQLPEFIINMS